MTSVSGIDLVGDMGLSPRNTGADLRAALSGTTPPDDAFAESIAEAISMVASEMTSGAAVGAAALSFPA